MKKTMKSVPEKNVVVRLLRFLYLIGQLFFAILVKNSDLNY